MNRLFFTHSKNSPKLNKYTFNTIHNETSNQNKGKGTLING